MNARTKVLIVDDSPVIRETLQTVLGSDPQIEVIGTAPDPYEAVRIMRQTAPDVITLDIEMPRMDGLTFLQRIMAQHPIPVVICSSHATEGAEATLKAFEYGAVDIITKPRLGTRDFLAESRILICDTIKAAAGVRRDRLGERTAQRRPVTPDTASAKSRAALDIPSASRVIVIGSSTGGTDAVAVFLESLPAESPGVVIVQHMPGQLTSAFARNLNAFCRVRVKEAADNDLVSPGTALIAPGERHTLLRRDGARLRLEVRDGPLVSRRRPSIDVLLRSAARHVGSHAIGVLLAGMGEDGPQGLKELHDTGAWTLVQDEATSAAFGIAQDAIQLGAVDRVLPLGQLALAALQRSREQALR